MNGVEVFSETGTLVEVVARIGDLTVARAAYREAVPRYPGRVVMLCNGGRILSAFADSGHHAATASSFSPRMTICRAPSGKGRGAVV